MPVVLLRHLDAVSGHVSQISHIDPRRTYVRDPRVPKVVRRRVDPCFSAHGVPHGPVEIVDLPQYAGCVNQGEVSDCGRNRSARAYLRYPQAECDQFAPLRGCLKHQIESLGIHLDCVQLALK